MKVLFGIGIGLILGVVCMYTYRSHNSMTDYQIEQKARELGMVYENEIKAVLKGDEHK